MATARSPKCSKGGASPPQDSCWDVPLVAMCACFFICMVQSSTGYLYVLFMDKYQINRGMASWPDSIILFCQTLGGFLVSLLLIRTSIYAVTLVSTVVGCVGLACAAFAPNITWMSVTLGAVYGTGFGAAIVSFTVFTMLYFDKYKATATAFKYVGWAMSGVAGPPVLSMLAKNYGLGGTLLLSAGITMHAVPLVMFLKSPRPVNFRWSQRKSLTAKPRSSGDNEQKGEGQGTAPRSSSSTHQQRLSPTVRTEFGKEQHAAFGSKLGTLDWRITRSDTTAISASSQSYLCASGSCTGCVPSSNARRDAEEFGKHSTFPTIHGQVAQKTFATQPTFMEDLSRQLTLFREPEFYILIVALTLSDCSVSMHTTTTVDYGRDKGVTLEDATLVITYSALGQFLGRTLLPFASDSVVNGRGKFTVACLAGAAVCYGVLSSVRSFPAFVAMNVALGLSEGFVSCIRGVLVNDYLGVERLPAFFGFQGVASVPFSFSGPTIIGFFRDTLGSYDHFYRILGAVNLCVAALIFMLLRQNRTRKKTFELPRMDLPPTGKPMSASEIQCAKEVPVAQKVPSFLALHEKVKNLEKDIHVSFTYSTEKTA